MRDINALEFKLKLYAIHEFDNSIYKNKIDFFKLNISIIF